MTALVQLAFVALSIILQVAFTYYLWRRLVSSTDVARPWRQWLTVGLIAGGASVPLTLLATRHVSPSVGLTVGWPVFLWMAFTGLMLVLLATMDLIRLTHFGARTIAGAAAPADPGRRVFLNRAVGVGAAATAVSMVGKGAYEALRDPDILEVPIRLSRLPEELDGFSLVQLTDVHIGNTIGRDFVENMVKRANEAAGDAIVITGDLIDGPLSKLRDAAAPLADLKAPSGVFFVTGNHEYYMGADEWLGYLADLGIHTLRNERVSIGKGSKSFDLAGIDDHGAGRWSGHGPDLARALAGRDRERELVLLAHQPRQVHQAARQEVGLQLSGHTHGGQIWPWHYLVKIQQGGLLAGHYRFGDTKLYVSRGTGYWGPPVRVGAPAEIGKIVLRAT